VAASNRRSGVGRRFTIAAVTSEELRARLTELGEQRVQAKQALAEADAELRELLVLGWRERLLTVVEMCRLAGISHETAYKILRAARSRSRSTGR